MRRAFIVLVAAATIAIVACDFLGFDHIPTCDTCTTADCPAKCQLDASEDTSSDAGAGDGGGAGCGEAGRDCLGGACNGGVCQPVALPSGTFCFTNGLALANGNVYYTTSGTVDAATDPPGHLLYLPTDGGSCDGGPCTLLDAPEGYLFNQIVTDGTNLYGVEFNQQTASLIVFKKSLGAGTPVTNSGVLSILGTGEHPIALDDGILYLRDGKSFKALPTADGFTGSATLIGTMSDTINAAPHIAVGPVQILIDAHINMTATSPGTRYVLTLPKSCGGTCNAVPVFSDPYKTYGIPVLATDAGSYWALNPTNAGGDAVYQCSTSCDAGTLLANFGRFAPVAIAADDAHVYALDNQNEMLSVDRTKGTGVAITPATLQNGDAGTLASVAAVDDKALYFVTVATLNAPCAGQLWRMAKF